MMNMRMKCHEFRISIQVYLIILTFHIHEIHSRIRHSQIRNSLIIIFAD
jgi:hypothetical protein